MFYTNPRLATPRGRQWCPECRPERLCAKHPFDPDYDRWTHNPSAWSEAIDDVHDIAHLENVTRDLVDALIPRELDIPLGASGDCPSELKGFACTRDVGHDGSHVAHGGGEPDAEVICWWKDGDEEPAYAPGRDIEDDECDCDACSGEIPENFGSRLEAIARGEIDVLSGEDDDPIRPECEGCTGGCCDIDDEDEHPGLIIFLVKRP